MTIGRKPNTKRPPAGSHHTAAFSVFDADNHRAIINLVPDSLRDALLPLRERFSEMQQKPEAGIRNLVKPDERDERLRLNFWDEYNYATQIDSEIRINQVLQGVCSVECWYEFYLKSPLKLIWMLTPPKYYSQSMKFILNMGLDRLTEMMSAKVVDKDGKLDVRAAGVILKAFHLVDLRVKGAIAQKVTIDQRTMNLNAEVNAEHMARLQMDELRNLSPDELLELEERAKLAERASRAMLRGESPDTKEAVLDIAFGNNDTGLPAKIDDLIDHEPETLELPDVKI